MITNKNIQNLVTWWRYAAKKTFFNFVKPPYDIIADVGQWRAPIATEQRLPPVDAQSASAQSTTHGSMAAKVHR